LLALAAGIAIALMGLVFPPARWLYNNAWFVGFLASAALYYALMRNSSHLAS
jgi:nucleobase:cation symporter-1, NCS1 family